MRGGRGSRRSPGPPLKPSLKIIRQGFAQKLAGPFDKAVHRAGGDLHDLGNFLVGEVPEAFQDQGPALVFRQGGEQAFQAAGQLGFLQGFQGIGGERGQLRGSFPRRPGNPGAPAP